jgi:energy-coupling factor transporter ATP-binding protein EcfA2
VRVRLRVQNFAALRAIDFEIPSGVNVLVGPNGSGKSTLLDVMELIRHAYDRGLSDAMGHHFGGAAEIRHYDAEPDAQISIGLRIDDSEWTTALLVSGAGVDPASPEMFTVDNRVKLRRAPISPYAIYKSEKIDVSESLAVRAVHERHPDDEAIERWVVFTKSIRVYRSYTYRVYDLMKFGSQSSPDRWLHVSGLNAFTVLRNWFLQRAFRPRYEFVRDSLRRIFPGDFSDFDFHCSTRNG